MSKQILLPKLGVSMEYGVITQWLKAEGDSIAAGEAVFEIETDKATQLYESDVSGYLLRILVEEGVETEVGTPVGIVGEKDEIVETVAAPVCAPEASAKSEAASAGPAIIASAENVSSEKKKIVATPRAKAKAKEAGVDLALVQAKKGDGRIREEDVLDYIASTAVQTAPPASGVVPYSGIRKITGEKLLESCLTKAHLTVDMEIDMGKALGMCQEARKLGKAVSVSDCILKACALMLREYPMLNAFLTGDEIRLNEIVNMGYAVDTERGLFVPVVRDVLNKDMETLALERKGLVKRALENRLELSQMEGGTFTISSMGTLGIASFTAIINPPQTGIMAVGSIEKKVVALPGDVIAIRPRMKVTISADHRVVDGAYVGRALLFLKDKLESYEL